MARLVAFGSIFAVPVSVLAIATILSAALPVAAQGIQPMPAVPPGSAANADPVVGRVNGDVILRSEVMREVESMPPQFAQFPLETLWPSLLDRVIDRKLIAAAANKDGLQKDPEYQSRMKDLGDRVLEQMYLEKRMDKQITEAAMQKRYAETIAQVQPIARVHARHILVKTRDEAVDILRDLAKGGDFAAIAKQKSQDGSAQAGGDLGWLTKDQLVGPFGDAAFAMKKGETSKAPVQTQFGWHIIRIDDIQADYKPSYDEKREEIQEALMQEVETAERARLRSGIKVERMTPDGSAPLPSPQPLPKK
jgi:peptidyl-prolyl cis-trans isomerase C